MHAYQEEEKKESSDQLLENIDDLDDDHGQPKLGLLIEEEIGYVIQEHEVLPDDGKAKKGEGAADTTPATDGSNASPSGE